MLCCWAREGRGEFHLQWLRRAQKQGKQCSVGSGVNHPNVRPSCTLVCSVAQSCPTPCDPMDYSLPGSSVHGILQARILEWVAVPFPQGIWSPALQACFLLSESPGKPKNTGVGSLSLLQQIFLTQESNQGLLHCRWILYQLSYQGSPKGLLAASRSQQRFFLRAFKGRKSMVMLI